MEEEDLKQIKKVQCQCYKADHNKTDILAIGVKENNFLQLLCFYCQATPLNSIMYPAKFLEQIKNLEQEAIQKDYAKMKEQKLKKNIQDNLEQKFEILKNEIKIAICNLKKLYEECNKFVLQYQKNQNLVIQKYSDIISDFKQRIQNSTNIQEQQQTLNTLSQYLKTENNSLKFNNEDLKQSKNNDGQYYDQVFKIIQIQISKINQEITQSMNFQDIQLYQQIISQQPQYYLSTGNIKVFHFINHFIELDVNGISNGGSKEEILKEFQRQGILNIEIEESGCDENSLKLDKMMNSDVVFLSFHDCKFQQKLGDLLEEYILKGGNVVVTQWTNCVCNKYIQGKFQYPLLPGNKGYDQNFDNNQVIKIHNENNPIFKDLSFNLRDHYPRGETNRVLTQKNENIKVQVIASFEDGLPFVGIREDSQGLVTSLLTMTGQRGGKWGLELGVRAMRLRKK